MGRKQKPIKLKYLEGNPGCRKLPENEPLLLIDEPIEPPSHLDEYAIEEWNRVAPDLETKGVICFLDVQLLGAYCCSYSLWRKATEQIKETDLIDETSNGNAIQNCLIGIANKAAADMLKFGSEFGLTPSVRARLGFDWGRKKKSKWDGLLGKNIDLKRD
jgi:P27 family predicted phage terminase small subunit